MSGLLKLVNKRVLTHSSLVLLLLLLYLGFHRLMELVGLLLTSKVQPHGKFLTTTEKSPTEHNTIHKLLHYTSLIPRLSFSCRERSWV